VIEEVSPELAVFFWVFLLVFVCLLIWRRRK
jgi:hypothetical protein